MEASGAAQWRIGDRERDEAVEQLREHHGDGRLDVVEFEDRLGRALAARTREDLAVLFTDLPPLPGHPAMDAAGLAVPAPSTDTPAPRSSNVWNWRQAVSGAAFPLAVVVCFATGWRYWWIMLVPMIVTAALLGDDDDDEDSKDDEALGEGDQKSLPKGSS